MAVESSKSRNRYQEELADLQAEYSRKKKKIVDANEGEIDDLQGQYQQKKKILSEQNEAAINHIQKKQQDSVEKYAAGREIASERGRVQVEKMENNYAAKIEDLQSDRTEVISKLTNEKREKLQKINNQNEAKVQEARVDGKKELEKVKVKYDHEVKDNNEKSLSRLESTRAQNQQMITSERDRGEMSQDKVRGTYEKQVKKIRNDGDAKTEYEKNRSTANLQKVDNEYKKQYDKKFQTWAQRERNLQEGYAQKLEHQKGNHQQILGKQEEHFEKVYDKNEFDNHKSLEIQEGRYTKQLLNEKRKFLRESQKYAGKEDDPFYKIQERGSSISETPSSYIVKAYSPDHEKDLVHVTVDRSKAVVSGQRSFNDKIEDEKRKVTTDSYQSFREEFKFDKPVATEAMVRERRGDYVVFEIPKLSQVEGSGLKLSKKA